MSLHERGARVVSVFGPFASRALVEMPTTVAQELFDGDPLGACGPTGLLDATLRDIDAMPEVVAKSSLAAGALAMAREIEHPYNSATSKSMCMKSLMEALDRLRALTPPKREADGIDRIAAQRKKRRSAVGGQ